LFMVHNVLLSVGSGLLLAVMLEEVSSAPARREPGAQRLNSLLLQLIPIISREGLLGSICNTKAWTPKMEQFYMINNYVRLLRFPHSAPVSACAENNSLTRLSRSSHSSSVSSQLCAPALTNAEG